MFGNNQAFIYARMLKWSVRTFDKCMRFPQFATSLTLTVESKDGSCFPPILGDLDNRSSVERQHLCLEEYWFKKERKEETGPL